MKFADAFFCIQGKKPGNGDGKWSSTSNFGFFRESVSETNTGKVLTAKAVELLAQEAEAIHCPCRKAGASTRTRASDIERQPLVSCVSA